MNPSVKYCVKVTTAADSPFIGGADGIPLASAPLVRVLCQVQWPEQTLLSTLFAQISDEIAIALAKDYPTRTVPQGVGFEFDPQTGQVRQQSLPPSRQWSSVDEHWAIYFTPTFVTLENRGHYTSKEDMTGRFQSILAIVEKSAQIPAAQRIGWRYVNRVADPEDVSNISDLVEVSVLGAKAISLPPHIELRHSLSDTLFIDGSRSLAAKWGFLPAGAGYDQNVQPTPGPSWILDLDAFSDARVPFESKALADQVRELSSFAYNFFRWSVKDAFIDRFGGRK